MFEICAVLGARSQRLRQYGHLLGVLYHGCDDVGDQRGLEALGGGGEEDIRDGILTLPAALAIRDPRDPRAVRESTTTTRSGSRRLARRLPRAARRRRAGPRPGSPTRRARRPGEFADEPAPLLALVDEVRLLSQR